MIFMIAQIYSNHTTGVAATKSTATAITTADAVVVIVTAKKAQAWRRHHAVVVVAAPIASRGERVPAQPSHGR